MQTVGFPLFRRAMAVGLSAAYALTNVVWAHATETTFWGERQRASRDRSFSTPLKSDSILAGLPKNTSRTAPFLPLFEHPTEINIAGYSCLGKNGAEGSNPRILQIAQSIRPFGTVRYVRESKKAGAPLIIHIQDVHGNLGAQQNMGGMVHALARDSGVRLVGMEGAWGAFAVDEFRLYPNPDIVKQVGLYFLKKDLIGGPEYAGLAGDQPLTLWGIENPTLYRANVDAVKGSLANRERAETFLASLNHSLETLKKSRYSLPLLSFDQNQSLYYDHGQRGLGDYLQALVGFNGTAPAPLAVRFPNVVRFLSAIKEEKALDFSAVERERRGLVSSLAEHLSPMEQQGLLQRSVDLRAGTLSHNDYHLYLQELCDRKGVNLGTRPTLLAYMHYVGASEKIERDALLAEIAALEISAQDALIETEDQRTLVTLSRDALRLKKLIANELTPDEWTAYAAHRDPTLQLASRLNSLDPSLSVPSLDLPALLDPFEGFCARAMDRNTVLVENLLSKMKGENQRTAVLVAGGFHSDGLMDDLKKRGVSVVVLTPTIGPLDPRHRALDVFAQDPLPLEKIFTGEPIALKSLCGLSIEGKGRRVIDALHFGIVGLSLKIKNDFLVQTGTRKAKIQDALNGLLDDLTRLVPALHGMELAVSARGGEGISLSMTGEKQPHSVHFNGARQGNGGASPHHAPTEPQKRFARLPGTAIPGIVDFLTEFFKVSPQQAILFHANVLQSFFIFILLFYAATGFDALPMDTRILPAVFYVFFSHLFAEFRQKVYRFDLTANEWVSQPIPPGGTKHFLRISELIFNLPILAFFFLNPSVSSAQLGTRSISFLLLSVLLRSGTNVVSHQLNRRQARSIPPKAAPPFSHEIEQVIQAFEEGSLSKVLPLLPPDVSFSDLNNALLVIAQKTVQGALGKAKFRKGEITDGPYDSYLSDDVPVVIKIPNQEILASDRLSDQDLRASFTLAKDRMGGLFVPMTLLNSFPIHTKEGATLTKHFVIVQQKWEDIRTLELGTGERWDSLNSGQKQWLQDFRRKREERFTDFLAAMEGRNLAYQTPLRPEMGLGIVHDNTWVAHRVHGIQFIDGGSHRVVRDSTKGNPASTKRRVPDVFADQIRDAQRNYLFSSVFKNHPKEKPHSVFGLSFLERVFRSLGFSGSNSVALAKVFVILLIPIGETVLYGFGTPALAQILSAAPYGIGLVPFTSLIVGIVSATLHVVLWHLHGEKVTTTDFVSWFFMGSFFSVPFQIYTSTGWAGELPWLISWFSHMYVNGFVVTGSAKAMGELLNINWLKHLKPGSLVKGGGPDIFQEPSLSPKERMSFRTSLFQAISSFSGPLTLGGSRKEMDLEINDHWYRVFYGQGETFNEWVRTQLSVEKLLTAENEPLRIVDFGFEKSYSYMATQIIKEEKGASPLIESNLLPPISEEGLVREFVGKISAAYNASGNQSLNRRYLKVLVKDLYPEIQDRADFPTKSLMATAGAVVFFALRNTKLDPHNVIAYLDTAKSFQDILAMHNDPNQLIRVYNRFAVYFFEPNYLNLNDWFRKHEAFISFLQTPKPTDLRPVVSPVPAVSSLELDTQAQGNLELKDVLLGGGKSIELDLLFRRYKPTNRPNPQTDADQFRSFLRKKVLGNWGTTHVKDPWLATVTTEDEGSIGLSVAESRMAATARGSLRWWTFAELWLAVSTPRDWLNWRYYVVRWKERAIFRGGAGFSAKDRLKRAAVFTSLLRSAGNSALASQEISSGGNQWGQTFDVDLLLGAAEVAGESASSIFTPYNLILEQAARVDFWRAFSSSDSLNSLVDPAGTPQGMNVGTLIFHVDALLPGSPMDENSQREVAAALAGILLSNRSDPLKKQVYLVSSVDSISGQPINPVWLASILVKKYGALFERVKGHNLILPGTGKSFCSKMAGDSAWTIHLAPLLQDLGLINNAESVRFWTHDNTHIDNGNLPVQIENILTLAKKIQEFFSIQTFLQTNA